MPVVMKLKDERACPTVICDVCRKEIKDAKDGNAQWMMGEEEAGATLYFTHKKCCHAFDTAAQESGRLSGAQELSHFMVYLSNNLKMDWENARSGVGMLASIG